MIDYSLVDKWYRFGIPKKFISTQLLDFVLKSNTITSFVKEIPIKLDAKARSAYTDGKSCFLAGVYFQREFYEKILYIDNELEQIKACIAVNNGIQIHEALHVFILGEMDKNDMMDTNKNSSKYKNDAVFSDVLNIVEDLYSENLCFYNNKKAFVFLETMNNIFFNENAVNSRKDVLLYNPVLTSILNMLPVFRNRKYLDSSLSDECGIQKFTDILFKALDTNLTVYDRVQIAIELRDLIETDKDLSEQASNINKEIVNKETIDIPVVENETLNNISKIINQNEVELDKLTKFIQVQQEINNISTVPVEFIEVTQYSSYQDIEIDSSFNNFANLLRHFRQEKNSNGTGVILGNKFKPNQFYKYTIDGKIMSIDDKQITKKGNPNVILLIDASGSMRGELLDKTINVCYSVFVSLKNNNIPCAVYAHTTLRANSLVIGVASYLMPLMTDKIVNTNNNLSRFEKLHGVRCSENADGFAIDFVAKRFAKNNDDKFLIVLSDGKPAFMSYRYNGYTGVNHTREIVNKLNKENIYVVSMSLTKDVVRANNDIYGNDRNLEAFGNLLQDNMKKLIYKITTRN